MTRAGDNNPDATRPTAGVYAGVALLAAASLALEVYLTRVYSILAWSYMAFIVVSVALLGLGAAGTALALVGDRWTARPGRAMAACALGFGASAYAGTAAVGHFPAAVGPTFASLATHGPMLVYYLVSATPFFFFGFAMALAFRSWPRAAGRLYFFDLGGAAAGAFVVVGAMNLVGGTGTLALVAVLAAAAAAAFAPSPHRLPAAGALAAAAIVVALAAPGLFEIHASPQKFLPFITKAYGARVEREYWSALGRVEVSSYGGAKAGPFRGISQAYAGPGPTVKWITIDGGAETPIVAAGPGEPDLAFLDYYLPALAYKFRPPADVLIVGAGGGVDVLAALAAGARRVDAVELNPAIVRAGREDYAAFNGGVFRRPGVHLYTAEGRSFVRGSGRRYDLIQLSLVDTFTAAASGAHALSENYLYTREAFQDYYRHLKPGGVLTVTRNHFQFPHEELRLAALAYEAMRCEGEASPENALAVFTNGLQASVIVRRGGFSEADVARLRAAAAGKFETLWLPGSPAEARLFERIYRDRRLDAYLFLKRRPFSRTEVADLDKEAGGNGYRLLYSSAFLRGWNEFSAFLAEPDKERFYRRYFYDVRPPRDDRPFFFLASKWRNVYLTAAVAAPAGFLEGTNFVLMPHTPQLLLALTALEAAALSLVFLVAPLAAFRRRAVRTRGRGVFVLYFLLLGAGFMFVEIPLIQKFTLYLGHPVYAFAAALATLLGASGLGSLMGERLGGARRWLPFVVVAGLAVAYPAALDRVLGATLGWPLAARVALAAAALAPLGFFLGMPFPAGIRALGEREPALVPWAWAANGCASVVGPAAAVLMATSWGHNAVLAAAAVAYAGAFAAFNLALRREGRARGNTASTAAAPLC